MPTKKQETYEKDSLTVKKDTCQDSKPETGFTWTVPQSSKGKSVRGTQDLAKKVIWKKDGPFRVLQVRINTVTVDVKGANSVISVNCYTPVRTSIETRIAKEVERHDDVPSKASRTPPINRKEKREGGGGAKTKFGSGRVLLGTSGNKGSRLTNWKTKADSADRNIRQ